MISFGSHENSAIYMYVNGQKTQSMHNSGGSAYSTASVILKKGDYVQRMGGYIGNDDDEWSQWSCIRLGDQ